MSEEQPEPRGVPIKATPRVVGEMAVRILQLEKNVGKITQILTDLAEKLNPPAPPSNYAPQMPQGAVSGTAVGGMTDQSKIDAAQKLQGSQFLLTMLDRLLGGGQGSMGNMGEVLQSMMARSFAEDLISWQLVRRGWMRNMVNSGTLSKSESDQFDNVSKKIWGKQGVDALGSVGSDQPAS